MRIERDRGVLTIINTDPPINRMTVEHMDAIESILAEARSDSSVRALVFTADSEENFNVGMNLKQLRTGAEARGGVDAMLDQRRPVLR